MCFYLPSKYQEDHHHNDHQEDHHHDDHPEDHHHGDHPEDHQHDDHPDCHRRHAALPAPPPLDNANVYLVTRPDMYVFVRRFGGWAITHDSWEKQKEALEADLLHDRHKYDLDAYFTVGYDSPWQLTKRSTI